MCDCAFRASLVTELYQVGVEMRSDARLGAALFSIGAVSLYVYRSRFTGSQAVVSEDRPDDGADDGKELQDLDPPPVDEQREEDFKKEEPTSFRDLPPPSWGTGELVRLFDSSGRRPFLTVLVERRSGGGGPNGVSPIIYTFFTSTLFFFTSFIIHSVHM